MSVAEITALSADLYEEDRMNEGWRVDSAAKKTTFVEGPSQFQHPQ